MENQDVIAAAEMTTSNGGFLASASESASGILATAREWVNENPILATTVAVVSLAGIGYLVYKKWFAGEK